MAQQQQDPNSFRLSKSLIADGDPVRCLTFMSDNNAMVSGSQSGALSSIDLSGEARIMQTVGVRHSHHITAIASSHDNKRYVTGCKDNLIRVFDSATHGLIATLNGHEKAVTSLSWFDNNNDGQLLLISGSWDGTAKMWNLETGTCVATLPGHENTVSVQGLPHGRLATGSAGIAQGNQIHDHKIRIWEVSITSPLVANVTLLQTVANDHNGPIRGLAFDYESQYLLSCSNDGTVKIRDSSTGECVSTLVYPSTTEQQQPPMFLAVAYLGKGRIVACTEDGNAVVWNMSETQQGPQIIPHPNCVWSVTPLSPQDFATACNDGFIRFFTLEPSRFAPADEIASFHDAVSEARAKTSTGPSAEEIAGLPKWEMNSLTLGRSEGQVQVFNKGGKAIAAQWSAASGAWIEVGEVTGSDQNTGTIEGVRYKHVFPIEIDVAAGGVKTLQIGYNDGDNPFAVAQKFIDDHMLDQGYLAQIADYIRSRVGEAAGPTLGTDNNNTSSAATTTALPTNSNTSTSAYSSVAVSAVQYKYIPMKGYKYFEAGMERKSMDKMLNKIRDFGASAPSLEVLDGLCTTLSATSRYHSSIIATNEVCEVQKMIKEWDLAQVFPALDLARLMVLHPDASRLDRKDDWANIIDGALHQCETLISLLSSTPPNDIGATPAVAIPMLSMRLFANCFHVGTGGAYNAIVSRLHRVLNVCNKYIESKNKNIRLAVATLILNICSHMHLIKGGASCNDGASSDDILSAIGAIIGSGLYEAEAIVRVLVALGTLLLADPAAKAKAQSLNMTSMVQSAANPHGEVAKGVAEEIHSILQ